MPPGPSRLASPLPPSSLPPHVPLLLLRKKPHTIKLLLFQWHWLSAMQCGGVASGGEAWEEGGRATSCLSEDGRECVGVRELRLVKAGQRGRAGDEGKQGRA